MAMQGDELKTIRVELGLTQQQFADAIGMSRKAVNVMEGGAPIERRTELAARYLAEHPEFPTGG
jgi:DNA-binding XRE family transcriptional regulator